MPDAQFKRTPDPGRPTPNGRQRPVDLRRLDSCRAVDLQKVLPDPLFLAQSPASGVRRLESWQASATILTR